MTRLRVAAACGALAVGALTVVTPATSAPAQSQRSAQPARPARPVPEPHVRWPSAGEAAYVLGDGRVVVGPHQRVVPIASVAKVMTAYLVLQAAPLHAGDDGFRLTVRRRDVVDTARRRAGDESVVAVVRGEVLRRTVHTDPSGLLASTRSTAHDQLLLALAAMRKPAFAAMVRRHGYCIPVAGRIHNTDTLLGQHGFVGIKTGSDSAAGGCFAFRSRRRIDGTVHPITGVVLGQPGPDLVAAGLTASRSLVDSIVHSPEASP